MNDRGLRILEQYDLKVINTRRGRGSFIIETDRGLKMVMEAAGSANKLRFQNKVLYHLRGQGYGNVDCVVENMEGNLISVDKDETTYLVKDWFEGRECDTKSDDDILAAVRNLARLHQLMELPVEEETGQYIGASLVEELDRRNREIKKVRNFIYGRQRKNAFERGYLDSYGEFFEQALESSELLRSSSYDVLREKSLKAGAVCHGEYNQHHVLICRNGMATTDFSKCRYDVQIGDLYQFLRKILEKQNWSVRIGMAMLQEYDKMRSLSRPEREHLKCRLAYPEKFWKLANHYYNCKKSWMPGKNVEKLEMLKTQQEKRSVFLKAMD